MPEGYFISPHNPNADQGGGDIITPTHQTVDVQGPWVVFPSVDCAEAQGQLNLPHTTLPLSALKTILREAEGVAADNTGGEGDIRDKIAKQAAPTVDWEDIPVEDQNAFQAQFPKGGITRTQYGVVDVPATGTHPASPPQELEAIKNIALVTVPGELPPETPNEDGGYSPVEETPTI